MDEKHIGTRKEIRKDEKYGQQERKRKIDLYTYDRNIEGETGVLNSVPKGRLMDKRQTDDSQID